jgi:hypothetical protein
VPTSEFEPHAVAATDRPYRGRRLPQLWLR